MFELSEVEDMLSYQNGRHWVCRFITNKKPGEGKDKSYLMARWSSVGSQSLKGGGVSFSPATVSLNASPGVLVGVNGHGVLFPAYGTLHIKGTLAR